nr:hypothetical protein [Tanacetum cinerariifolium]
MTSFDYRLNPLYPIKECSSCGALYTTDYCCSVWILEDKIICDLDKTPDFSQRFPQNCPKCGHPVDDSFEPSNDNPNVANAPRELFVVNQDPECIFCHQCTCKLCGNGAHYGYNYPPKVSIILYLENFNNQTIKELSPTVQSFDPKSDLVHDSPNVFDLPPPLPFILCEFYENDARYGHYSTPQVSFVYPKPCYNQDFNFSQDFHDLCCENYGVTHEACQSIYRQSSYLQCSKGPFNSQNKLMEQLTSICDMIHACYDDDDDDYAFAITPNEPNNSLSMRDEHLDTIMAMESDEFLKSSVENLVPNPSESKGENECDVPAYEEFTTFSNSLFDSDYDFYSSDDQSFSDEDFPKEIYSNPLFDEEIIPMKIDPHPFNEETHFIKRLLYDNSSPRPSKEFVFENSDAEIESFSPSPIPVEDSDSLMKEIDLSFTPDYPTSSGIEDDDYDSERDVLILHELLSNDSLSLLENESFHFDISSFSRPLAKPPDGNTGILNVKMMGDIPKQKVPMPRLMITLVSNQEKSPDLLSHQSLEAF